MMTRRLFFVASAAFTESAYAQRAAVAYKLPPDTVYLNANEFPEGVPQVSLNAMQQVMASANRYHYQEFGQIYSRIAASEDLRADQLLVGAGSSEPIHAAVEAFTGADRPLITPDPSYELPAELARAMGRKVIRVPLGDGYRADVHRLAESAKQAGGGLIYLCNPNNPTAAIVPKNEVSWLISNLPENTVLLVDEAYYHFAETPDYGTALDAVRAGKNVIVARTFSKIYGMAGLRVGFIAGRADLIEKMAPFRNNVISIVSARAVTAALDHANTIVPPRRASISKTRGELCSWLKSSGTPFIQPHANFMMIDVSPRDCRYYIPRFAEKGVAVGRPFPPLEKMLRVSIGTDADMAKFKEVFRSLRA